MSHDTVTNFRETATNQADFAGTPGFFFFFQAHTHQRAHVFGSVCTDQFNASSDIDLLVSFNKIPLGEYTENFWSLEETLKNLLQRDIDIVVEKNLRNPFFIKVMVNQTKTAIYE